jgi:hypothetical protein
METFAVVLGCAGFGIGLLSALMFIGLRIDAVVEELENLNDNLKRGKE